MLKPGQARTYTIRPAITADEKPLIMGPTSQFSFETPAPDKITLTNHSDQMVVCVVAVVPAFVANATTLPWGDLWQALQQPGGPQQVLQGLINHLQRRFLPTDES